MHQSLKDFEVLSVSCTRRKACIMITRRPAPAAVKDEGG